MKAFRQDVVLSDDFSALASVSEMMVGELDDDIEDLQNDQSVVVVPDPENTKSFSLISRNDELLEGFVLGLKSFGSLVQEAQNASASASAD